MEIEEVTPKIYYSFIKSPTHLFNAATFNDLNKSKCETVFYLLFKDSKIRFGITLGLRDNKLYSPFSAPYGGFDHLREDTKLFQIDNALEALLHWAKEKLFLGVKIIIPPFFFNRNYSAKMVNCFYRAGFEVNNKELNYHFKTKNLNEDYYQMIWYNARKNLKKSLTNLLSFSKLSLENGKIAYDIIAQNRKERGFPLRLTFEQLEETGEIIPIDYFIVEEGDNKIGAAIVFRLSATVARVVYWGDLTEYSKLKTMNFLSYHIFKYYKEIGVSIIDIGHSTVDSVPNHGLCEFKESIGCSIDLLYEFYKKIN
tara:strand:+ start:49 stop:984 length:936 start_codon:yes stop_codon:yes gene_type:complete